MNPTSKKVNISPDAGEKVYWRQPDVFADLFNAYLYGGEQVIAAEELEEQDTDTSRILEIGGTCESVKGARDVIRLAKRYHGTEYAILAIENQEGIRVFTMSPYKGRIEEVLTNRHPYRRTHGVGVGIAIYS